MEGGEIRGPVWDQLFTGEAVAIASRLVLSRRARSRVRVRVVGESSVGWAEAAESWGAALEAVVVGSNREFNEVIRILTTATPITIAEAFRLHTVREWEGILAASILTLDDAVLVAKLFQKWRPAVALISLPGKLNRREAVKLLPPSRNDYTRTMRRCKHSNFGGVTTMACHVVHLTRLQDPRARPPMMTVTSYPRTLQTVLDDTLGGDQRVSSFEKREDMDELPIGVVTLKRIAKQVPVFSAASLGPDISAMTVEERTIWVRANSVRSRDPVVRQVNIHELHAMWDYEGKLEVKHWTTLQRWKVLRNRLLSPPAKIIRTFLTQASVALLGDAHVRPSKSEPGTGTSGLTRDITFASLEANVSTRVAATQADEAEVDLSVWALPNETPLQARARATLQKFAVKWWAMNLEREAEAWLAAHGNLAVDRDAIADCIWRVKATTYWQWIRGSRLLFWRFPDEFRNEMRDGTEFFHLAEAPKGLPHNLPSPSREAELESRKKVFKLKFQHYVEPKYVDLVVPRFAIVKVVVDGVVQDIRVVWDSKSNGHNLTLWAPGFMLPDLGDVEEHVAKWLAMPVAQYLEMGSPPQDYSQPASTFTKSIQGDVDVGQHFHNFIAHTKERHALGVRCIETKNDGSYESHTLWRFNRLHFGGRSLPYLACQGQGRILEVCEGDRHDLNNQWQWDRVHCNLPFMKRYDCSMPRVMLLRKDGELATRQATFVDDIHPTGRDSEGKEVTKEACHQLKSRMNSKGNQADDRKYRPPSPTPGAWNGCIIHTDTPFPMKSTTSKKWNKFRDGLDWVWEVSKSSATINTARLRRLAGLGVNVTEVYGDARPYLKGFFNAIESFRNNRDLDGWRYQAVMDQAQLLEREHAEESMGQTDYPEETNVTSELILHVEALRTLFLSDVPRLVPLRPSDVHKIRYTVGDASAEGFGVGTQYPDLEFEGRDGLWLPEFAEGGSNLREGQNIANHILFDIRSGRHDGCELWMVTDNAVWSYVWTKGMSTARHLFRLVLEVKVAAREHEVYLRSLHISGSRMIATGMDGWSRGNYDAGVSLGFDIRDFIPLHRSAFEVAGDALEGWCKSWMGDDYSTPLEPEGWFEEGHQPGVHIWAPPPAAALIALKEMAKSRHKRPFTTTHVVIIPRLAYQEEWRRRFEKEVDMWFCRTPGSSNRSENEWWQLAPPCQKCRSRVTYESGIICANFGVTRGHFHPCEGAWCAGCFTAHSLDVAEIKVPRDFNGATLSEIEDEVRYCQARPGDHLCLPFQCPNCQSQNIRGCDLNPGYIDDEAFECLVIRATLDAFWSRASKTVAGHVREVRFMVRYGAALGFAPFPPLGPWPLYCHLGMMQAILVVTRSMEKGRGDNLYVKYGTARKARGTLTILWESSPFAGADITLSSGSVAGRFIATLCPSEGRWYQRFETGINARIGDIVSQDRAYTIEVLLALLEMYEEEWAEKGLEIPMLSICACMFLLVSCLGGMRGFEVVWTDLAALRYDVNFCNEKEDETGVSWPIVGRFKARHGVLDCFMIPIAGTTSSGIQFFTWTQRFLARLAMNGQVDGWAFKRPNGDRAKASDYRTDIFTKLEKIQATTNLIDEDCNVWDDYGVQRSGRRFFTTRCTNKKVPKHEVELQCRWQADRANGVRTVQRSMIHLYSEVRNMIESLIRPSKAC